MEITINIDEAKILELAKTNSIEDLPRSIFYQAKSEAVEKAVNEIKSKLVETPYYGSKEILYSEVRDSLYKGIQDTVKKFVEEKFNEKSIQNLVDLYSKKVFEGWIEKKVYERLEEVKADIFIGSSGELERQREDELQALQDQQSN